MQVSLVVDSNDHIQATPIDENGAKIGETFELPAGLYNCEQKADEEASTDDGSVKMVTNITFHNGQRIAFQTADVGDDGYLF